MADVLEQFLSGGQTSQPAKGASVITDQLLDSLRRVESGKDRFAINKETKAMGPYQFMPETVQMLHKQGIEFNPFNEQQAREAAKTYLGQLVERNKGDVNKALAQYGGFVTKDPSKYVSNVLGGAKETPQAAPVASTGDPLEAFLSGKPVTTAKAAPVAPQAAPVSQQEGYYDAVNPHAPGGARYAVRQAIDQAQEPGGVRQLVGKFLKGGLETRAAVPGFLASAADVVAGAPSAVAGLVGYGAGRVFGLSPEEATAASQKVAAPLAAPVGRATGLAETQAYKQSLPTQVMEYIGKNINEGAQSIAQKFGVPVQDVEAAINAGLMATGAAAPKVIGAAKKAAGELQVVKPGQPSQPRQAAQPGMVSMGAAAVPDAATIKQALSVATPELQKALANIPPEKVNLPTLQRHIEADTLPVPVRLTEGQATGDIVKLSNEQNRRGKDPALAQRFNEQNGQLVENLGLIREKAAPDVYGTKTIENSQGIIDAYKSMDSAKTADISKAYKALEDANGGQFPVDGKALATNAEAMLGKKLKSEFLPSSIKSQLERFKSGEPMTFEQFEAMRTNLAAEIRKAERSGDGNAAQASSIVRQALEDLPMQGSAAAALKPLADTARSLAKQRFDLLKKDPAYKAAVDDIVPADKYIDKFVINGVNKNINTMVQNLGKDSPAHQHMAAGTVNWLKDKAGIVDETGNFRQDSYNRALKKLEDVKNLQEIFNPEAASQLKTLGNVARYTQAQPRGAFVNNSNTLVGAMADKAAYAMEQGANIVGGGKMGIPIGSMIRNRVQQYKATKETEKALETGAGTKQTGQ
jgi:hypothetical protein